MNTYILLFISFVFLFGCNSSQETSDRYEPEFTGQFVNSEQKIQASYEIPDIYCFKNDSIFKSFLTSVYYLAKPVPQLDTLGFLIHPFPNDTMSVRHSRYMYHNNRNDRLVKGMKVTLINNSPDTLILYNQDGSMIMIQEAMDPSGEWKPIEYWVYSWCGNSVGRTYFLPYSALDIAAFRYKGNFKTQLRFKMEFYDENSKNPGNKKTKIYSKPFGGSVNYSQFHKMKTDVFTNFLD